MSETNANRLALYAVVVSFALFVLGVHTCLDATLMEKLPKDEWRCIIRDVESGRCDVYERRERQP